MNSYLPILLQEVNKHADHYIYQYHAIASYVSSYDIVGFVQGTYKFHEFHRCWRYVYAKQKHLGCKKVRSKRSSSYLTIAT